VFPVTKYADGPTVSERIEIAGSAAAVWAEISDPTMPARHSQELQEASWDPDGPEPGVGARIFGRNQNPHIGEWTTTSWVVAWEENVGWSWLVADQEAPASQWWFAIEPSGDGVALTQTVRLGPGPSGLTGAIEAMPDKEERIVERRLEFHRENMRANLEAVKAAVEAAVDGDPCAPASR
jgi:hypothetical protein